MLLSRRGMGQSCAQLGPLPAGYACKDSGGEGVLTQVGAAPTTVNVGASGANTLFSSAMDEQVQNCVATGGELADCISAVAFVNAPASGGMPGWLLPVGIGVLGLLLVKAFTR